MADKNYIAVHVHGHDAVASMVCLCDNTVHGHDAVASMVCLCDSTVHKCALCLVQEKLLDKNYFLMSLETFSQCWLILLGILTCGWFFGIV